MFHEETAFKHRDCGVIRRYTGPLKTAYQCAGCGAWANDLLELLDLPEVKAGRMTGNGDQQTEDEGAVDKLNFITPG